MRRKKGLAAIILGFGVSCALVANLVQANTVGRTAGQFSVSPTGAAIYSIPIWAPSGPQGVGPQISLVYGSQSGIGPEGMGWSISGLSSISRCNRTVAQDGVPASVALTYADALCLDGQRLRLTSSEDQSTYGHDGTTYQTEVAEFSNVTAHGATGSGPTYFTVLGKNGWKYEYGNTADSRVMAGSTGTASAWMLDKVTDRSENAMTVRWEAADSNLAGMTVPQSISWTQGQFGMTFAYASESLPVVSGYLAGTVVQSSYVLSNIFITAPSGIRANYVFGYTASTTTGQSTLTSLTQCADFNQTNCLYPTVMTYQSGQAGVSTSSPNTVPSSSFRANDTLYSAFDLNGDGINDLVYYDSGTWYVAFGSASGYAAAISTGISDPLATLGYIDSSGAAAFVANQSSQWWYYKWNPNTQAFAGTLIAASVPHQYSATLADINGDGLADLVYINADTNHINVIYNVSTGAGVTFQSGTPTDAGGAPVFEFKGSFGSQAKLDFTGDGQGDLLGAYGYSAFGVGYVSYYVLHFSGGQYPTTYTSTQVVGNIPSATGLTFDVGDYNDDGCMDFLVASQLVFSGCNGAPSTTVAFSYPAVGGINWDGGGRRAVLANDQGELVIYNSLGDSLGSPTDTGLPFNSSYTYFALPNPTGDGSDALGVFNQTSTPTSIQYYLHKGAGQPPDLLTSITDGYGNSASPSYVSIAQSSYVRTADAEYPYSNFSGPMYVVNNVLFSDPTSAAPGTTYSNGYSYTGGWMNLQGRGFSGFKSMRRTDSRTMSPALPGGLTDTALFERAFPYTGMESEDTIAAGASNVRDTIKTPPCTPFLPCASTTLDSNAGNQRYLPYFSSVVTKQWELNGTPISTETTTYSIPDVYGNTQTVTQVMQETDPGAPSAYAGKTWTTVTSNSFEEDSANWCFSLLTQQTVAYSSTDGGAPVTRTTGFTPDPIYCRYTQRVTEPSGSVYYPNYSVTEDLTYDTFGNRHTVTVTGNGMAPRTTKLDWNATGQYPQYLTNALNQVTTLGYDPYWGVQTSIKNPNNLQHSWVYDLSFGQLTEEDRTDGTSTKWVYSDCGAASPSGCLLGAHGLVVNTTVYNTDHSTVMTDGNDYYDPLERKLVSTRRSLSTGAYGRNELRLDNLGNVSTQSVPCAWVNIGTACPTQYAYTYDVLNRMTNATLQTATLPVTRWAYSGDTLVVTDPNGNTRTRVSDSAGRFRQAIDANGYAINLDYDAAGSLVQRTDNLGRTLWTSGTSLSAPGPIKYGIAAFTENSTDLASGTRSIQFDALGERTMLTDGNGNVTTWGTPDALSRMTSRKEVVPSDHSRNFFTQWNWDGAANGIGKLQSVCTLSGGTPNMCTTSSGGYSESYEFDAAGRLQQQHIVIPGTPSSTTYTYQFAYNASGLLGDLTYPTPVGNPLQVQYNYTNGLLQSVVDVNDAVTVWTAGVINSAGQVTQETLGNAVVVTRTVDPTTLQLTGIDAGVPQSPLLESQRYMYFPSGNVKQRQDNRAGLSENFTYDGLNRLYSSQLITASGTSTNLQTCFDNTDGSCSNTQKGPGLITSKIADSGTPVGYTVTWSPYNYPTLIQNAQESINFSYGQDRQRWQQNYNNGAEVTNYIGSRLEQVISGASTTYRHYIYAGAEPVAILTPGSPSNKLEYILSENQGSVAALVNSSGTTDVNESFTAYGARRNPSTGVGTPSSTDLNAIAGVTRQGYTFQTALGQALQLNHMNGRVQDAVTGQFLSPDPHIPDPTNTQDANRYGYVENNPTTHIDPSGFASCTPQQIIWNLLNWHLVTINGALDPSESSVTPGGIRVDDGNPCVNAPTPPLNYVESYGSGAGPDNAPKGNPCPAARPISKLDMSPVIFTDDNGNPILGPDGEAMRRPAGIDPHFYTAAGAADAAKYGSDTFFVDDLKKFGVGKDWDAQRAGGHFYTEYRAFASVAIGLYGAANGKTSDQMNFTADVYAKFNSDFKNAVMDTDFPDLPEQNVSMVELGATLAKTGGGLGICTPTVAKPQK